MPILVYITTSNEDEARSLGLMLVEKKLAACVNIFPAIKSIYVWKGALEQSEEAALIAKTEEDRFAELREAVIAAHSYETPCIVSLPITGGDTEFLNFVRQNSRP